jgi:hypothetical protein
LSERYTRSNLHADLFVHAWKKQALADLLQANAKDCKCQVSLDMQSCSKTVRVRLAFKFFQQLSRDAISFLLRNLYSDQRAVCYNQRLKQLSIVLSEDAYSLKFNPLLFPQILF